MRVGMSAALLPLAFLLLLEELAGWPLHGGICGCWLLVGGVHGIKKQGSLGMLPQLH